MLRNKFALLICILFLATGWGEAAAAKVVTEKMTRLGQGEVRYLKLIKVYSASLYADTPDLRPGTSRCLVLEYAVSLDPDAMVTAANQILGRQHSPATIARFQSQLDALHSSYRKVEKGDRYSLCYNAVKDETSLALNNQVLVSIPSAAFAELYFGIWLSNRQPIDDTLRQQLLSGANQGDRT